MIDETLRVVNLARPLPLPSPERSTELGPGVLWLRQWLLLDEQVKLVADCRALMDGPAGGYVPTVRGGGKMRVRMMCLGRHWNALTYTYQSGDVFVVGGPARLRYHGVARIFAGTSPVPLAVEGRFNLTFRLFDHFETAAASRPRDPFPARSCLKYRVFTRFARLGLGCSLVVSIGALLSAQDWVLQPPVSGALGVMRQDGLFLPLASVQNNKWRALAVNRQGGGSQFSADAGRLSTEGWRLIRPRGAAASFALTKAFTAAFECSRSQVFDTTIASGKRLAGADTARTIGIGVRGNVPIERAADLSAANDPRSRRIRDLISGAAQAMETERFESFRVDDPYRNFVSLRRFSAADRTARTLRFRRLFYHKAGLHDWYYFEAQKDYPEVDRRFVIMGWIGAFGDESAMVDVHAGVIGRPALDDPVGEPSEVLGVVPPRGATSTATWIMVRRTTLDLTITLHQVDEEYRVKPVVDVLVSHCVP